MKLYTDYTAEEIETISTTIKKAENNEWIEEEELKLFNQYKKAVEYAQWNFETFWADKDFINKEVEEQLKKVYKKAITIYDKLRTVKTYDLYQVCEYIVENDKANNHTPDNDRLSVEMAKRVVDKKTTQSDEQFIREVFEKSNTRQYIKTVRRLQTPLKYRKWATAWTRPSQYGQFPSDCTNLYNKETHYVYIHSRCDGKWGDTYWISDNGSNTLEAMPVIKDFQNFDFKIKSFYKITCTNIKYFGNDKRKYDMKIEESSEKEFFKNNYLAFARR